MAAVCTGPRYDDDGGDDVLQIGSRDLLAWNTACNIAHIAVRPELDPSWIRASDDRPPVPAVGHGARVQYSTRISSTLHPLLYYLTLREPMLTKFGG